MISSPTNPRVKALVRLRRRRERDRTGQFLVEGRREVERAIAADMAVDDLYSHEQAPGPPPDSELLSAPVFAKVAYRETSELIAVVRQFPTELEGIDPGPEPLVLVVEAVEKPGNLGAMIRSAAAAGCAAVVIADPVTDVFNPNVVRGSLGTMFDMPLAVADGSRVRAWLGERDITWWASSEHGTVPHWTAPLAGSAALVVGREIDGLSADWLSDPSRTLVIPAAQPASLNTATAAAVLLFEARRQRIGQPSR